MNSRRVGIILAFIFIVGLTVSTVYSRGFAERQKPLVSIVGGESRILVWSMETRGYAQKASEIFQDRFDWMMIVTVMPEDYQDYMSEFHMVQGWPVGIILDGKGFEWPGTIVQRQDTVAGIYLTIGFNAMSSDPFEGEGARVLLSIEMDNMPFMVPESALRHDPFENVYYLYFVTRRDGMWGREFVAQRQNVSLGFPSRMGQLVNIMGVLEAEMRRPVITYADQPLYDGVVVRLFD